MPSSKWGIETLRDILKSDRYSTLTSDDLKELNEIREEDNKSPATLTPQGTLHPAVRKETLATLRVWLVDSITIKDLNWNWLGLKMGQRSPGYAPFRVQVCQPIQKYGLWVPVTAKETWDLAYKLGGPSGFHLVPLTRAVFDQYFNAAVDEKKNVNASSVLGAFKSNMKLADALPDFEKFSSTLKSNTNYDNDYGSGGPLVGAHKLWPLSAAASEDKPVNYGLHHPGSTPSQGVHGSYLYRGYTTINGLIRAHDWHHHWDYSQLLQFMMDLKDDQFTSLSLRKILQQNQPLSSKEQKALKAVWDEPLKPSNLSWYRGII